MKTWRERWGKSNVQIPRRNLQIASGVVALAVLTAGIYFWGIPAYQSRQELAETRRLLDDLELTRATDRLDAYLKQHPNDGEAHLLSARANRMIGLLPTAWSQLRQAEALSGPAADVALEKLLLVAQQSGELGPQTGVLQYYLDSNAPEAPLILNALALGAHRVRRFDLADRWLTQWVEQFPQDWRGHFFRARFYCNRGLWGKAEAEFQAALALQPDFAESHHWLGVALVRAGHNYAEAIEHLQISLKATPNSATALTALAQAQLALDRRDVAAATVQTLLQQEPANVWGLLILAQLRIEEGQFEQALAALDRVAIPETADPREPAMLLFLQARCHRFLKNVEKAEAYERQYRAMDSDIQQLRTALDQIASAGQKPEMQRKIGLIYLRLGSYTEAIQWLNAVLRVNPNDKIAHQGLAECYDRRSDPESRERAAHHRRQAQ